MSTTATQPLPLFPLNTVLFPNSSLALRIFEPRYLDLVSHCLKQDRGFGICLIHEGSETGGAATPHTIGTLARITDWYQHPDGILGITVRGETRFRIVSTETQLDQQVTAHTELLPEGMAGTISPDYSSLIALLHQSLAQAGIEAADTAGQHDDAGWVSYRLGSCCRFHWHKNRRYWRSAIRCSVWHTFTAHWANNLYSSVSGVPPRAAASPRHPNCYSAICRAPCAAPAAIQQCRRPATP